MVAALETKYKEHKDDVINLVILILIASVLGVYLIATTVLIAKDGVNYIERAQKLSSDPVGIITVHPPGYPFFIFVAHKFVTLFTDNSSVLTWIYTAQSVTLLCRLIEGVDYIVSLGKDESEQLKVDRVLQEKLSLRLDKRMKKIQVNYL